MPYMAPRISRATCATENPNSAARSRSIPTSSSGDPWSSDTARFSTSGNSAARIRFTSRAAASEASWSFDLISTSTGDREENPLPAE